MILSRGGVKCRIISIDLSISEVVTFFVDIIDMISQMTHISLKDIDKYKLEK